MVELYIYKCIYTYIRYVVAAPMMPLLLWLPPAAEFNFSADASLYSICDAHKAKVMLVNKLAESERKERDGGQRKIRRKRKKQVLKVLLLLVAPAGGLLYFVTDMFSLDFPCQQRSTT